MHKEIVTFQDGSHKFIEHDHFQSASTFNFPDAGTLSGTGDPVGIDGEYKSKMFWAPQEYWNGSNFWVAVASVGPSWRLSGDVGHILFNRDNFAVDDYTTYHERGHNLGFKHDDGGIMSYQSEDIHTDSISDVT